MTDRIEPQKTLLRHTLAAVRATPQVEPDLFCLMLGRSTPLDGLGGLLWFDAHSTASDDAVQTFKPAHLAESQPGRWRVFLVNTWSGTADPNTLDDFGIQGQLYVQLDAGGNVLLIWVKGASGWSFNA